MNIDRLSRVEPLGVSCVGAARGGDMRNFSETAVLAKDAEEAQLFNDMQNDMVSQVMRRLSTVRGF